MKMEQGPDGILHNGMLGSCYRLIRDWHRGRARKGYWVRTSRAQPAMVAPRMMCMMNWHVGLVVIVAKACLADSNGL